MSYGLIILYTLQPVEKKISSNLETKFKFNFHLLFFGIFLNGKTSANYQLIKSVYWKILSRVDKVGLYLPVQGNT